MPNVPTIDCLNGRVQKTQLQQVCQHSLSQPRGSPQGCVPAVCRISRLLSLFDLTADQYADYSGKDVSALLRRVVREVYLITQLALY
jgi:hypothetical protein